MATIKVRKQANAREKIELRYTVLPQGHFGYTDDRSTTLAQGYEPHIEFSTLVHELTHALLHFTSERPDLTTRETEAEAVAWLVCEQLDVPDTHLSIDYIKAYRGTPETLTGSLERIRATALCHIADAFRNAVPGRGMHGR